MERIEFTEELTYEDFISVFAWYHLTGGDGEYTPDWEEDS